MTDLRNVFWIGGGTGAGKSSVAIALARRHRLERYDYDWHDARGHSTRTRADRHPVRAAVLAMSVDERWVRRTPAAMASETIAQFRERFELVVEDLAVLRADRVIADGFGLLPELVAPLLADRRQAIFLLPTAVFREEALARRGWVTIEGTTDPDRARRTRLERDARLTKYVRRTALSRDLAAVVIDGSRTLEEVSALVERHFGLTDDALVVVSP